jgi:hypothetical protein
MERAGCRVEMPRAMEREEKREKSNHTVGPNADASMDSADPGLPIHLCEGQSWGRKAGDIEEEGFPSCQAQLSVIE